jgi:hypothetical protein
VSIVSGSEPTCTEVSVHVERKLKEDLLGQEVSLVGYDVFKQRRSTSWRIHVWNGAYPLPSHPMPMSMTDERI